MKLPKPILEVLHNRIHTVVAGRTGSGKSNLIKIISAWLLERNIPLILIDGAGEHNSLPLHRIKPKFSYNCLKELLPSILESTVKTSSGIGIAHAILSAVEEGAKSWNELIACLKRMSNYPERDLGARGTLRRLLPLKMQGLLSDDGPLLKPSVIVDLSFINDIYTRKIVQAFTISTLYSMAVNGLGNYVLIIEEVGQLINGEDPLIIEMLTQLRKYCVKIVLTDQRVREHYLQSNIVLFDQGLQGYKLILNGGIDAKVLRLKVGEALVFNIEEHSWKKVRIPLFLGDSSGEAYP